MLHFTAKIFIYTLPILLLSACGSDDHYSGYIEGEYIYIASSLGGHLTELSVTRGTQVQAGAPLFQLDSEKETLLVNEAKQNLQIAQSQLENIQKGKREVEVTALKATLEQAKILQQIAETRFNRNSKLAKTGAVSQDQFDESQSVYERSKSDVIEHEAELELGLLGGRVDEINAAAANVNAKQEALDLALWKVGEKTLSAKAAAYVQDTLYRVGEWVPAGRPVVSLLPPENIKARFFISEAVLAKVQVGQTIEVTCDGCRNSMIGKISYISSEAEFTPPVIFSQETREKLVYMVEARFEEAVAKQLHPGQPIDIQLKKL